VAYVLFVAAALTFVLLGYSPIAIAKKGVTIWLVIVLIVAVPLYSAFEQMKSTISLQQKLTNITFRLQKHDVTLRHIEVLPQAKGLEVRCEVIATGVLSADEKKMLKEVIEKTGRFSDAAHISKASASKRNDAFRIFLAHDGIGKCITECMGHM